jgi:hypothetical protein
MRTHTQLWTGACLCLALLAVPSARADEPKKDEEKAEKPSQGQLIKDLEKTLTGAKMTGQFTVTGKDDKPPAKEEYTITSAQKLPEGDLWLIKANIKYGKTDKTFPIPLEIKWAGDTPVITLTNLAIPGLGTFSSRVVIYEGRYAGTWQHDAVGGHLFGTIEKGEPKGEESKKEEK